MYGLQFSYLGSAVVRSISPVCLTEEQRKLINSNKQTAEEYRLDAALMKMVEKVEEQFKKDQAIANQRSVCARSALVGCARGARLTS